jgi:hypothetical protein
MSTSERNPLLQNPSTSAVAYIQKPPKYGLDLKSPTETLVPPLGPLEISSHARHGILAGIWLAQFLSVCLSHFPDRRLSG